MSRQGLATDFPSTSRRISAFHFFLVALTQNLTPQELVGQVRKFKSHWFDRLQIRWALETNSSPLVSQVGGPGSLQGSLPGGL